jgi:hypothetical protein
MEAGRHSPKLQVPRQRHIHTFRWKRGDTRRNCRYLDSAIYIHSDGSGKTLAESAGFMAASSCMLSWLHSCVCIMLCTYIRSIYRDVHVHQIHLYVMLLMKVSIPHRFDLLACIKARSSVAATAGFSHYINFLDVPLWTQDTSPSLVRLDGLSTPRTAYITMPLVGPCPPLARCLGLLATPAANRTCPVAHVTCACMSLARAPHSNMAKHLSVVILPSKHMIALARG